MYIYMHIYIKYIYINTYIYIAILSSKYTLISFSHVKSALKILNFFSELSKQLHG